MYLKFFNLAKELDKDVTHPQKHRQLREKSSLQNWVQS